MDMQMQQSVKAMLASRMDDMFLNTRIATWIPHNLAAVDESVLAIINVISQGESRSNDNIDALIYAGKIVEEKDKNSNIACVHTSRSK